MQGAAGAVLGLQLAPAITFVVLVTRDLRKQNPWECSSDARVVLITIGASSGSKDLALFHVLFAVCVAEQRSTWDGFELLGFIVRGS